MCHLQTLHEKYGHKGLVILGFNCSDDKKIALEFLRENKATFPTILDSSEAATRTGFGEYRMSGVPLNYIIDRHGKVVDAWYGYERGHKRALAALEKAELDLARCTIRAPFNAIVQDKSVDLGATVSTTSNLVTLIGTDEAWVRVKVPLHEIKWITIPQSNGDPASEVTIRNPMAWGPGQSRTGRVLRLMGELEPEGLLTQVLVSVKDPFSHSPENRGQPQVLMGSLVSAQIQGRMLESVIPIERPYVRDNDTVWIMNGDDELEIRSIEIAFRGPTHVYVNDGLAENERLVTTDIAAPVAGMPLRVTQADNRGDAPAVSAAVPGGS